ncbi:hypothetical protein PROVRETT_06908 [Providencia rettgeri DSM 1131]|nr:hypothetical protein PROVRETT_06908 [Providencia rettgeri DSM 1131]
MYFYFCWPRSCDFAYIFANNRFIDFKSRHNFSTMFLQVTDQKLLIFPKPY